jgi:hypothetical protein
MLVARHHLDSLALDRPGFSAETAYRNQIGRTKYCNNAYNQPDNQLLKCYNICSQNGCATVVQNRVENHFALLQDPFFKLENLTRIDYYDMSFSSHCKRATTYVAQLFLPLANLLNRREQFRVKLFTLFVSLLTCALCLHAHDVYNTETYTSFGAAQRPESLMLGTEHRIYCIQFGSKPAPGAAAAA